MAFASKCAFVVVILFALALTNNGVVDAGRSLSKSHRKPSSSGGGHSSQVTQPSYNTHNNNNNGGSNSHADVAKLSYPNYNSQPNRPATGNAAPAPGWNVPQGPPPAYSATNPAGGGRTNVHEAPPAYNNNNNYGGAYGSNVHQPITATQNHGQQYAGVPPGATYYPAGSHVPGGGYQPGNLPAGATYYPSAGHMPNGGYHPGVAAPPPGATYYQAGSALPPGATYYAQPPQQSSSGLGFGTGLLAGGLGGALLGHALTPSGNSGSSQPVAAAPAAAGQDRIIIINNGVPVEANANGTTVINAGGAAEPTAPLTPMAPMNITQTDAAAPPAQLAPFSPGNATNDGAAAAAGAPPPPGGIICVPTKMNETDPADSSKMIEVEKIACYPAPPAPAAAPGAEPVPLAPMSPNSQATNQSPPAMLPPDQAAVRSNTSGAAGIGNLQCVWSLIPVALVARFLLLSN